MEELEFDAPLFKKLSHNDTGAAVGHQGGMLIPKDLDRYFPDLSGQVSAASPTVDEHIRAALFVGDIPRGVVSTRYQYQTWGAERPAERRITTNLGPLRNAAAAGDYLLIERGVTDSKFYRMRLLKPGTPAHKALEERVGSKRWGPADKANPPVTEAAADVAENEQFVHESHPLQLFDNTAALSETRVTRIARSRAFQRRICNLYSNRCALCDGGLVSPAGSTEIEAAHIVPRSLKGADDARNGLCLCRSHHWAFDRGLFGVNHHAEIEIPAKVAALPENAALVAFASKQLRLPAMASLSPATAALSWHLANIVAIHH